MKFLSLFLAILLGIGSTGSAGQVPSYADLVAGVQGAVVNIRSTQEVRNVREGGDNPFEFFFGPRRRGPNPSQSAGSGFIISADGYIVTNRHVVEDAKEIRVILNNSEEFPGTLIGTDDNLDIALVKIDKKGLTHLNLGDSDQMRIGDGALALGYPLQLGFTVTTGIISGIGRNMRTDNLDLATYLQTDADITFGNSGGPLINTKGEVIGINTMIVTGGETYGFAIPSNLFKSSIEQLRESGTVRRGALGVALAELSAEARDYYKIKNGGVLVNTVTKGLPAEKAGFEPGDVILAIDEVEVDSPDAVIATISRKMPGDRVQMICLDQKGKKVERTVTLTDRRRLAGGVFQDPEDRGQKPEETIENVSELGFSVKPIDPRIRRQMGLDQGFRGVIVDDIDESSSASQKGIDVGDLILQINNVAVNEPADIKKAVKDVLKGQAVPIRILEINRDSYGYSQQERTVFLRKEK